VDCLCQFRIGLRKVISGEKQHINGQNSAKQAHKI